MSPPGVIAAPSPSILRIRLSTLHVIPSLRLFLRSALRLLRRHGRHAFEEPVLSDESSIDRWIPFSMLSEEDDTNSGMGSLSVSLGIEILRDTPALSVTIVVVNG